MIYVAWYALRKENQKYFMLLRLFQRCHGNIRRIFYIVRRAASCHYHCLSASDNKNKTTQAGKNCLHILIAASCHILEMTDHNQLDEKVYEQSIGQQTLKILVSCCKGLRLYTIYDITSNTRLTFDVYLCWKEKKPQSAKKLYDNCLGCTSTMHARGKKAGNVSQRIFVTLQL